MTPSDVMKLIKEKEVKWADLRFTDTRGKEQHVTIPAKLVDDGLFRDGKMFDGSSIGGWKGINESDMILMPEADTAILDPFFEESTVNIRCDVIEPATMQGYERDPRVPSASVPRPTSRARASPTVRCSVPRTNSSSSTACAGRTSCMAARTKSTPCRARGTATPNIRKATRVIVPASRAVTSRCRRSTLTRTSAMRCAAPAKSSASSSKCTTTKWPRAVSVKSASDPAASSRRLTRCRS